MDNSAQQYYVLMFMRNQAGGKMSSFCFSNHKQFHMAVCII